MSAMAPQTNGCYDTTAKHDKVVAMAPQTKHDKVSPQTKHDKTKHDKVVAMTPQTKHDKVVAMAPQPNMTRQCLTSQIQCDQKQLFDRFCVEQFKDRDDKTSKTISRENGQRIVNVIKKDPSAVTYSSQFKFWVKKKRFELINHLALGVKDVLCLPAKTQNTNDTTVMAKWRRVAFIDEFFEEVHCRQKGHIGSIK
eukprot:Em0010g194a